MLLALTVALTLGAGGAEQLDAARKLVTGLRLAEAVPILEKARATSGNDFATLTEILWLQGYIAASLGKTNEARTAFRTLCSIQPDYPVPAGLSPRVMSPFFEAKGWATTEGALKFEVGPPETVGGRIVAVQAKVAADPLGLGRKVRFHLRGTSGAWYAADAVVDHARAPVEWATAELIYFVELLGEADEVVAFSGTEIAPITARVAPAMVSAPVAPPPRVEASRPFFGPVRVAGVGVLVAAAASAVLGGVFAAQSNAAAGQIRDAPRDATGAFTGLTQRQAFALDDQAATGSALATGFFIGGGALALGGAAMFIFGAPGEAAP